LLPVLEQMRVVEISGPIASLAEACARLEGASAAFDRAADRALAAGFAADRLGYAFVGGYRAALFRLVPSLGPSARAALCATEEGGVHPRAIATRIEGPPGARVVTGRKAFATLATCASELLVVASAGFDGAKNRLELARVAVDAPGITIRPHPPLAFAPEVPHAEVLLKGAPVLEVLPGDGYMDYLKPFRTIEDIYVFLALLGYLARVSRENRWADLGDVFERAEALHALAGADPTEAPTHMALGAEIDACRALVARLPWASAAGEARVRWERDGALLWVAEGARAKRLEAARRRQ
jgi:alkylation response protein AidB-like acyl-CoA dehydrogenase